MADQKPNSTYGLPVSVSETWVADDSEDGQVLFELVHFSLLLHCHSLGSLVLETLAQFVQSPPHVPYFLSDHLRVQTKEGS